MKPIFGNDPPAPVCAELKSAQKTLDAKRKLTLIMSSKSVSVPVIAVEDLVQCFLYRI